MTAPALLARPSAAFPRGAAPAALMVSAHFPPTIGGTEGQAHALAAGLVSAGHRMTVLTMARPGTPGHEELDGVRLERVLTGRGRGIVFATTYGLSLLRHLRRLQPGHGILHAHHLYLEAMTAVWVGLRAGLPIIAKVAGGGANGDFARLRRTGLARGLPLLRRLSRVVAVSAAIEAELLAHGFAPDRIARIPNGVDVGRFAPAPDPEAARAQAGLGPETVLFLGRLSPEKGLDAALSAWSRVAPRHPGARLVLVGDGSARSSLEAQARTLGLGETVRFLPERSDPEVVLRASQIFLLPSRSEGMSNALLEAMATGLACVATHIGGNNELLEHGTTGLLVPPGDAPALANALVALLEDPGLRTRLGRAARTVAIERYAMDRVVRRYADLYGMLTRGTG